MAKWNSYRFKHYKNRFSLLFLDTSRLQLSSNL